MRISVIIPTFNAEKYLNKLLETLKEQTVKVKEIIVVDSSSTDRTVEIARSNGAEVRQIRREAFDHGGTRTFAGKESSGDIVVFMTHDSLPVNRHAIETLVRPLNDKDIGACFGRQLPCKDASFFARHLRYFNYPETSYIRQLKDKDKFGLRAAFLSNSFSAYSRNAIEEVGWFKDNLIMGEDTCAAARILLSGYKIMYVAEAAVYHSHNYTVLQEFQRYFDIGVFHKLESWLIEEFGSPQGEGLKYVRSEFLYLLENHRIHLLPEMFLRSVSKFVGYRLGRKYDKLNRNIIRNFSMHKHWWDSQY